MNKLEEKLNGAGPALRIITPLMTFLIATLLTFMVTDIREVKTDLKAFRVNVNTLETRVAVIESNRFTAKDGTAIMKAVVDKLPPKWLLDKVQDHSNRIRGLEGGRNP